MMTQLARGGLVKGNLCLSVLVRNMYPSMRKSKQRKLKAVQGNRSGNLS